LRGKRIALLALAVCRILTVSTPLAAQDSGPVPVRVLLNTADKGDQIVVLTKKGDILVSKEALAEWGVGSLPEKTVDFEGAPHISLGGMKPELEFKLDLNTLTLKITTDARRLGRHVVDYAATDNGTATVESQNSAYLNYNLTYTLDTNDEFLLLAVPWEVAIRLGRTLIASTFNFLIRPTEEGREEESVRLLTNLTWDFPEEQLRLTAGDFQARGGRLGGSGLFGGLNLARNFSLTPHFVAQPLVGFSGLAQTPSLVEVYLNNNLLKRENVPPGPFELLNLPNTLGRGEVVVEITDAFGRTERFAVPFFVSPSQLKPGLQAFNYSLGARREKFGEENNEYGDPAFLGLHRVGLTGFLTGGVSLEAGRNQFTDVTVSSEVIENGVANFGLTADLTLGPVGQINLNAAVSRERPVEDAQEEFPEEDAQEQERSGRAGSLDYNFIHKLFAFSMSWQAQSRDYANLGLSARADNTRRFRAANIAFNLGGAGSISATYSHNEPWEASASKTTNATYSYSLGRNVSFIFQGRRSITLNADNTEETSKSASAGVLVSFGGGHTAGFNAQRQDDGLDSRSLRYQKGVPAGTGFGYRLSANRSYTADNTHRDSQSGSLTYSGDFGQYTVTRNRTESTEKIHDTSFSVSGAVALIGGSVHPSRPIRDAFALVRIGNLSGIPVLLKNQEAGKTDREGEYLVSGLDSYHKNAIAIRDSGVPMEFQLSHTRSEIIPPFRGGVLVEFRADRFQAFTGRIHYRVNGKKVSADLSSLDVILKDRTEEGAVGRDGEFYLENVPPGTYPARVYNNDLDCDFKLHIPESEETFVDLGEVYCETN